MQSLSLAIKNRGEEGTALPNPLKRLEGIGVRLIRSQLSLIAGAPGGGKSSLATHLISRMRYEDGSGVPAMYFSADADRMTQAKGILAGLMHKTQTEVEELLLTEDKFVHEVMREQLSHVWWNFDTLPSIKDINEELEAYAYVYGEYPHIVVIDNLIDIADAGEDLSRLSDVQVALKDIGRRTRAHIMLLHHVTGPYTDGTVPIPRSGIMHKLDKKAELILTLHLVQPAVMGVRVVKNRVNPAATNATFGVDLAWMPERGWISE